MIILDSNIWIATLNENDSLHKQAQELIQSIQDVFVIPEYVVAEVCTVLTLRTDKAKVNEFIDFVGDTKSSLLLYSQPAVFQSVLTFFQLPQLSDLSFIDVLLLYLSQEYTVYTFDNHLDKAIKKLSQKGQFKPLSFYRLYGII